MFNFLRLPRGPGEPPKQKGLPPTPVTKRVFAILSKGGTPSADDMAKAAAEQLNVRKHGWEFETEKIAYQGDVYRHMEEMLHFWRRLNRVHRELLRRKKLIEDEIMEAEERKRRRAMLTARSQRVARIRQRAPMSEATKLLISIFNAFAAGMILRRVVRSLTPR